MVTRSKRMNATRTWRNSEDMFNRCNTFYVQAYHEFKMYFVRVTGDDTIWQIAYKFLVAFHCNYDTILYRFWDKARYLSKNTRSNCSIFQPRKLWFQKLIAVNTGFQGWKMARFTPVFMFTGISNYDRHKPNLQFTCADFPFHASHLA